MASWILSCVFITIGDLLHKWSHGEFFSSFEFITLVCLFGIFLNTVNKD